MGPERKLYQKIKKCFTDFSLIRLENSSLLGTPDLLVCNASGHFFTIELKTTKANKIRFSPHQISFHERHPKNTFILVQALGPGTIKLFEGRFIQDLVREGFKYPGACSLELEAWRLLLAACCLKNSFLRFASSL